MRWSCDTWEAVQAKQKGKSWDITSDIDNKKLGFKESFNWTFEDKLEKGNEF